MLATTTAPGADRRTRTDRIALAVVAAAWVPFTPWGHGFDNDTFGSLGSGDLLLTDGVYVPSRPPGYLVFEVASAALGRVGGPLLVNLVSVALGLVFVDLVLRLCREHAVPWRAGVAVVSALGPVAWTTAPTTIDYFWALGLTAAALALLRRGWAVPAGVVLGLAVSCRFTTVLLAGALLWLLLRTGGVTRAPLVRAVAVAATVAAACFVPAVVHAGGLAGVLTTPVPASSLVTTTGQWVHKNLLLWGVPGAVALAFLLPRTVRRTATGLRERDPLVVTATALVVAYEALCWWWPFEAAYLLPMAPFVLMLVARAYAGRPRGPAVFAALVVASNLVTVSLLAPAGAAPASAARSAPAVTAGELVVRTQERWELRACADLPCWREVQRR